MNKRIRIHKRPIAEINIVPYVDVMLVLLIIFMITAPMLTQGVQIDLPQAKAEVLPQDSKPPLIVSVDSQGLMYLDNGQTPIDHNDLAIKLQATLKRDPARAVLVKGDKNANYGQVMKAMVLLKQNGASKVGLMTEYLEEKS